MKFTERRRKQEPDVDFDKIEKILNQIFREIAESNFTLKEAKILTKELDYAVEKMQRHSPTTLLKNTDYYSSSLETS